MPFSRFRERRRRDRTAHALYVAVVEQARQPVFYQAWTVPDTVDGRFDLLAIHAFLAMRRLGRVGGPVAAEARALSQALFDLMFADMDQNLREMGVTDLAVGRKVHQMAEAFYGRISAYEKAFEEGEAELAAAIARNLYRKVEHDVPALAQEAARYLRRMDEVLAGQSDQDLMEGRMAFGPVE